MVVKVQLLHKLTNVVIDASVPIPVSERQYLPELFTHLSTYLLFFLVQLFSLVWLKTAIEIHFEINLSIFLVFFSGEKNNFVLKYTF